MDVLLSSSSIQFAKRKHHAPIQITTVHHNSQIFICVNKKNAKKKKEKERRCKRYYQNSNQNLPN